MADSDTNADFIEVERKTYLATGNAMHVWAAYSFARAVKAPPPDWVLRYFEQCSRGISKIASEATKSSGKDLGPKIMKALGLKGSNLTGYSEGVWIAHGMNVRRHLGENRDVKLHSAIQTTAKEWRVSYATVSRNWKRYEKTFPDDGITPIGLLPGRAKK
jgi:hypothetical protein